MKNSQSRHSLKINKKMEKKYLVAAYKYGHLAGYLGWQTVYGFKELKVFSPHAKRFATWKTFKGAERAINREREYNVNCIYVAKNWLAAEGYQLKVVSSLDLFEIDDNNK